MMRGTGTKIVKSTRKGGGRDCRFKQQEEYGDRH